MDVNYILEIHKILLKRLNPRIAGKVRDCDIWIGGNKKKFISTKKIEEELEYTLGVQSKGIEVAKRLGIHVADEVSRVNHISFEHVHPFEDGNGRVGRILYNIHRLNMKLPIHIIHEGEEQQEYYKWFVETH